MKKLLPLILLFNCYCSSNVPTNVDDFIFRSAKHDLIDAERQKKKCENMKSLLLLSMNPKDKNEIEKILLFDCHLSAYGYKNPNTSSREMGN